MTRTTIKFGAALGLLLSLAACENEQLFPNAALKPINPLFTRYVAMGNSITAGFQSAGIVDSTQLQAYPVLLARSMHTPFFSPLLNRPGCTPPIVSVFSNPRTYLDGAPAGACALRKTQSVPPPYINDVAVPGAYAYSILDNFAPAAHSNPLTTFFLGGMTQMQMLRKVDPTFVTAWIGNNDVLGAATNGANAGDSTLVTDTTTFKAEYKALIDSMNQGGHVQGAALIGVANVTLVPFFSKGSVYFAIKAGLVPGAAFPPTFIVGPNCAPNGLGGNGDSTLVPFTFGLPLVAAAAAGAADTLKCTEAQTVQPAELRFMVRAVNSYNTFIQAQATSHGYAYLDPNTLFASVAASIPAFPATSGAAAVSAPFGTYFSRDGVHPTALAHKLVADSLAARINAKYGTNLVLP